MILGVGIDLVDVASFAEQVDAPGSSFVAGTFTVAELRAATGPAGRAAHLAVRFAAKEAFIKAFAGARPGRAPVLADVNWREVELLRDPWGRPTIALYGRLAEAVSAALGPVNIHVSMTHEPAMAAAVVVIEGQAQR